MVLSWLGSFSKCVDRVKVVKGRLPHIQFKEGHTASERRELQDAAM